MSRNAGILMIALIFICFSLNSTFPLDKFVTKSFGFNSNQACVHRRFKDSTPEISNNTGYLNDVAKILNKNENDLKQYEQLVIMKKYPYLDLKEFEVKYMPFSNKNARQSIRFHSGKPWENEPRIHEPIEDSINVEIINRGLSGFAIPPQLSKTVEQYKINTDTNSDIFNFMTVNKKTPDNTILQSLKEEINTFIENKSAKN